MSFDFDAALAAPFPPQRDPRGLRPGASPLTPNVAPQRGVVRHLREKLAVLSCFASQALLARPGFDARPALDALSAQAAREHPDSLTFQSDRLATPGLGWAIDADDQVHETGTAWPEIGSCLRALAPTWRRAGLLSLAFAEDFAFLDGRRAVIEWLAVALPSMWAPEHKVGRSFAEMHDPVADADRGVDASAHRAAVVTSEPRCERFVWTITRHPRLHAHPHRVDPRPWPADLDADALAQQAWFRGERQTFISLPSLGQVIVIIAVDVQPLAQALAAPWRVASVRAALEAMSPAVLEYRGLAPARDRLLRWLAAREAA